ncbi:hypothetical protein VTK26DRAFT_3276 [Humicola hyalothermophila]
MVALARMRSSNSEVATALPPGLVAVFAGATSGIGESSLKRFAKATVKPRIYFFGRSKESGNRVVAELQKLNPEGEYIFISADLSLLRSVDDVCRGIKAKESAINLLFLSTGTMVSGKDTEEGLYFPTAVAIFSRLRFIVNLLPLLQNATGLRRVVSVFAGTKEGPVVATDDVQGRHLQMLSLRGRGHFSAVMTLALEAVAQRLGNSENRNSNHTVSFIHVYPGFVKTNLGSDVRGVGPAILRAVYNALLSLIGPWLAVPMEETGERHLFLATSARCRPAREEGGVATAAADGVPLPEGVEVARGTDGKIGSGIYSVAYDGECASTRVEQLLAGWRKDGTAQKVWAHFEEEFVRITGVVSI